DVVGGSVHVTGQVKFYIDIGAAILAGRLYVADPFNAGNPVFDNLSDTGLHDIGGCARIAGANRDYRRINVRVFPQRQAIERKYTKYHQQQRNYRREHRPFYADIGNEHRIPWKLWNGRSIRL